MKLKLKVMLTVVAMFFCFISPAFADNCIAIITCSNKKEARELAYDYTKRGYMAKISQISDDHYEVCAYDDSGSDIPKPQIFGSMEKAQYVGTYFFSTSEKADKFVNKMRRENLIAHRDDEPCRIIDYVKDEPSAIITWKPRVCVYI